MTAFARTIFCCLGGQSLTDSWTAANGAKMMNATALLNLEGRCAASDGSGQEKDYRPRPFGRRCFFS
jgi:hypothetical protein